MSGKYWIAPMWVLLVIYFDICYSSDVQLTQIYSTLDATACVRLLNKDGYLGCTSTSGGQFGTVQIISTEDDLTRFVHDLPKDKTAVAISPDLFNKNTVEVLSGADKLSGILVMRGNASVNGWSPESTFPNQEWGLHTDSDFIWNPNGDNLNAMDIRFPIFLLSEEDTALIKQTATQNSEYPKVGVQFHSFMYATLDTVTCLRRGQCLPVGGKSTWASFDQVTGTKPIIMAMANMDSTALFHDDAVGVDSTVSGIVSLIGAAMALQQVDRSGYTNDIVFAFWAGESFGYLGSSKFVKDIQHFQCQDYDSSSGICRKPYKVSLAFENVKLDNIATLIELNQIGNPSDGQLYLHQENDAGDELAQLLSSISSVSQLKTTLNLVDNAQLNLPGIPPSSAMSFLKARMSLPTVVITDHQTTYNNKFYHSHLDDGVQQTSDVQALCEAASILARSLHALASGSTTANLSIVAPCDTLQQIYSCLAFNFSCDYVSTFLPDTYLGTQPTYYPGVFAYSIDQQLLQPYMKFVHDIMANITAQSVTGDDCNACSSSSQCIAGKCVTSETYYHDAVSNGIDWDYEKYNWIVTNISEPMFVESNWETIGATIFLQDSPTSEAIFLTFGLVLTVLCFVFVFFADRYLRRNFKLF